MRFVSLLSIATCVLAGLTGCASTQPSAQYTARVEQSGSIECSSNAKVNCEISAVVWIKSEQGGTLIFANDKLPESRSEASVFSMPYAGGEFNAASPKQFFTQAPFAAVNKYEGTSISTDGQHVVAMSAFDRYREDDSNQDRFNNLLAWPANAPQNAKVVSASQRGNIVSSLAIRLKLEQALKKRYGSQVKYFKVEGLALLPGEKILFGVREIGQNYKVFDYKVTFIEGRYKILNGDFTIDESSEFAVVRDFSAAVELPGPKLGVSSLEYDTVNHLLYVLTSFEDESNQRVGAHLWVLPDDGGALGHDLKLVRTPEGKPFKFTNKAEGLAMLADGRIFIVHDDDRYITTVKTGMGGKWVERARNVNEAAFEILRVCGPKSVAPGCFTQP